MGNRRVLVSLGAAALLILLLAGSVLAQTRTFSFQMVRSGAVTTANCLPQASGQVTITSIGPVELLDLSVSGLPPNTDFDFFVLQLPNAPFGLSWYQGDIETDGTGRGSQHYIGRFNIETFFVAPGTGPAPVVHTQQPFPDQSSNPQFNPTHTFHLGLWFNSPADAQAAGCPNTVTPFNGDHTAGIQVLSTRNFANDQGPLRNVSAPPPPPTATPTSTATPTATATATTTLTPVPSLTPTATPASLSVAQAIAQVTISGQPGVPAASQVGQTVQVAGQVNGTGRVTGSMTWTLTATVPAGVVPGSVPVAVFSTTAGLEGFPCAAVAAGTPTVTCVGTTTGNALQGSTVTVVFPGGAKVTGTVTGPGLVALVPPLPPPPPPPPIVLPPVPPPPVVPVAAAPVAAIPPPAPSTGAGLPPVPVIPEADSLALVGFGLLGLAALVASRARRQE